VPAAGEAVPQGVFGPLIVQAARHQDAEDEDEAPEAEDADLSRKRQIDGQSHRMLNGSPAKRPRLSNGYENGTADSAITPMEIDDHHAENNHHAYPSPREGEPAPTPLPRTEGPEQGTQIPKVKNLTAETTYLRLTGDELATGAALGAGETSETRGAAVTAAASGANENPVVLHCQWNPKDPRFLAAAGSDALARLWTLTGATAPEPVANHVNGASHPFQRLLDMNEARDTLVTAMSWNGEGNLIAVATSLDNTARVSIWTSDARLELRFNVQEPPVTSLRWSPDSQSILALAPCDGGFMVTVVSTSNQDPVSYSLTRQPGLILGVDPSDASLDIDAAWISPDEFVICGGNHFAAYRYKAESSSIEKSREYRTQPEDRFMKLRKDRESCWAVTATAQGGLDVSDACGPVLIVYVGADTGQMWDVWEESKPRIPISVHAKTKSPAIINCLEWQPIHPGAAENERLLAVGDDNGLIVVWNVRALEAGPRYSVDLKAPVLALSFAPDGAFIAGATLDERIQIWKVGEQAAPHAIWGLEQNLRALSPGMSDESDDKDYSLSWDANGQRLAYGGKSCVSHSIFSLCRLGGLTSRSLPLSSFGHEAKLARNLSPPRCRIRL